jgi:hypothetical protein
MTDLETIEAARKLFASDTPGDKLARRLIKIAENSANWSALREKDKEISTLKAQRDELWDQLTPLKNAVLYARSQRRPMGIGQDSEIGAPTVTISFCPRYGRGTDNPGFWLDADNLEPSDADGPIATKRIALALLRLAYAIADKVRT